MLSLAAAALSIGACGSSNSDVVLTIGARGTPEEEILGQIYAQALRDAGYGVKENFDLDASFQEAPLEELRKGSISGYPEHVYEALKRSLEVEEGDLPSDPDEAGALAKSEFEKTGLTAFPPTPYSLDRPFVVLRKTADKKGLRNLSDLRGKSETMTLLGFSDCHLSRVDCLGGLEGLYRIYFKLIGYMYTPEEIGRRYKAIEDGDFDAMTTYSTDGRLAVDRDRFVALEDDKHRFRAGNTIFVTTQEAVDEAGPDFEETIVAAQEGLTLPVMRRLNAEVEFGKRDPAEVAEDYLRRTGLVE